MPDAQTFVKGLIASSAAVNSAEAQFNQLLAAADNLLKADQKNPYSQRDYDEAGRLNVKYFALLRNIAQYNMMAGEYNAAWKRSHSGPAPFALAPRTYTDYNATGFPADLPDCLRYMHNFGALLKAFEHSRPGGGVVLFGVDPSDFLWPANLPGIGKPVATAPAKKTASGNPGKGAGSPTSKGKPLASAMPKTKPCKPTLSRTTSSTPTVSKPCKPTSSKLAASTMTSSKPCKPTIAKLCKPTIAKPCKPTIPKPCKPTIPRP